MRLVCPNCEAKYEVPDDAIPDTGRDVQCANCGHAWFQMRQRPAAAVAEPVTPAAPVVEPEPEVVAEAATLSQDEEPAPGGEEIPEPAPVELPDEDPAEAPVVVPEEEPGDQPSEVPAPEEAPEIEAQPEAGSGYKVDESVLAILREEAEREARARQAEASPPAVAAAPVAVPVPAPAVAAVEEAKPAARRDLLPDVEEINSSLRPSEHPPELHETAADMPPPAAESGGGFRSGFLMVMTLAMIGSGLYIASPTLTRLVPALEGPLESYVTLVNSLRLQLDGVMQQATMALNGG